MSRLWDGASGFDEILVLDPGVLDDGGPLTVMIYWQPSSGEATSDHGFISGRTSGTEQWAITAFSGDYFHADDFDGGPSVLAGEWQIIGYSKAAGSANVRWHRWDSTGGWVHVDGSSTGDGSSIDELHLGRVFGARMRGLWVCTGVWQSDLSDAAVESACSPTALADWLAGSPDALWDGDQASASDPVLDRTGNGADQTSVIGTAPATSSTEPPGWSYDLGSATAGSGTTHAAATSTATPAKTGHGGATTRAAAIATTTAGKIARGLGAARGAARTIAATVAVHRGPGRTRAGATSTATATTIRGGAGTTRAAAISHHRASTPLLPAPPERSWTVPAADLTHEVAAADLTWEVPT